MAAGHAGKTRLVQFRVSVRNLKFDLCLCVNAKRQILQLQRSGRSAVARGKGQSPWVMVQRTCRTVVDRVKIDHRGDATRESTAELTHRQGVVQRNILLMNYLRKRGEVKGVFS